MSANYKLKKQVMKNLKSILFVIISIIISMSSVYGQKKDKKKKDKDNTQFVLSNEVDSVSYSLGVLIAENIKQGGLEDLDFDVFVQGIKDIIADDKVELIKKEQAGMLVNGYVMKQKEIQSAANTEEAKKFLEENKKNPDVIETSSGLQYIVLKEGTGESPKLTDKITAHYHGTLIDGTVFDSSVERGEPIQFPVNGVIPGWTEALQLMKVGSKYKLFIPSELGYGQNPPPGSVIEPGAVLIFEVELISIDK